jgi:short-subunit dehydrogenase
MAGTTIEGRRVLLTGASSGIGRELARELAQKGAILAISARRQRELEALAEEITRGGHREPVVIAADLAERGQAAQLAEQAADALGHVDVLINNAGGGVGGQIWVIGDRDEAREAFEINLWSPLALIRSVVPAMRDRGEGMVVNVTSMAQVSTWPGFGAYAATKAALALATETLALELIDSPIHVLEVAPGPVDTAVQGETRLAPGIELMLKRSPLGDARELARRIVRSMERGSARLIYPPRARVGYVLPALVRHDVRRLAARAAKEVDPALREGLTGLVVRTGSMGDEITRQARDAWERDRGRAPERE